VTLDVVVIVTVFEVATGKQCRKCRNSEPIYEETAYSVAVVELGTVLFV
jgi:hypothetical protein